MADPSKSYSRRVASAPPRPKQYVPTWSWWGPQGTNARPNNDVLTELMMKHGRQLKKFPVSLPTFPVPILNSDRSHISNAWHCNNKAFRQMYCTSARMPRRRSFQRPVTMTPDSSRDPQHVTNTKHGDKEMIKRTRSAPPARFHKQSHTSTSETIYSVL